MGLAAFNRMRQLEKMKPENIRKEQAVTKEIETPIINEPVEKTNSDVTSESTTENEIKSTTRRRRNNN